MEYKIKKTIKLRTGQWVTTTKPISINGYNIPKGRLLKILMASEDYIVFQEFVTKAHIMKFESFLESIRYAQ